MWTVSATKRKAGWQDRKAGCAVALMEEINVEKVWLAIRDIGQKTGAGNEMRRCDFH